MSRIFVFHTDLELAFNSDSRSNLCLNGKILCVGADTPDCLLQRREKTWQWRIPFPSDILPLFVCVSHSGNSPHRGLLLDMCLGVMSGTQLPVNTVNLLRTHGDGQGPDLSHGVRTTPSPSKQRPYAPIGSPVCGVPRSWPGWLKVPSFPTCWTGFVPGEQTCCRHRVLARTWVSQRPRSSRVQ